MPGLIKMDDMLRAIRAEYFAGLEGRYEGIAKDWTLLVQDEGGEVVLSDLMRRAHNLVGSGALYGLAELSEAARNFEVFLSELDDPTGAANSEAAEQGFALLEGLRIVMLNPIQEKIP